MGGLPGADCSLQSPTAPPARALARLRRACFRTLPLAVLGSSGTRSRRFGRAWAGRCGLWLAGHGLDHTAHTLRLWSQGGADRVGVTVRGERRDDLEAVQADFQRRYDDLLASTGLEDAVTLAARFGIDLHAPDFWEGSLDVIRKQIAAYVEVVDGL